MVARWYGAPSAPCAAAFPPVEHGPLRHTAAFGAEATFDSSGVGAAAYLWNSIKNAPVWTAVTTLLVVGIALALRQKRPAAMAALPGVAALILYGAATMSSANHDARFMLPV